MDCFEIYKEDIIMVHEWQNNEIITAEKLNSNSPLIINASQGTGNYQYHFVLNKTFKEIRDTFKQGRLCIINIYVAPNSIPNYYAEGFQINMVVTECSDSNENIFYINTNTSSSGFSSWVARDDINNYPIYYFGD